MKRINWSVAATLVLLISYARTYGQDPSFSQFFSSPLNINPALTGNINGDWRAISNFRDQWIGPASPYVTATVSYDKKILQNKIAHVAENNTLAVGGMIMTDYAMSGIVKSTYASGNLSYSIKLSDGGEDGASHRLTAGFGAIYGRKTVDFHRLDFEEQFTGSGFNVNLPTGEAALSNMKGYFSSSAGLTYSIKSPRSNLDLGVAGFHLNQPRQTFLQNENQRLSMRQVVHGNFETFITDRATISINAIYQTQARAKYFSAGGALGYFVSDENDVMLNVGMWYWSKSAVVPYLGLSYKDLQFGFSYDATISKLNEVNNKPRTWEFSVIIRGIKDPTGIIPCPWK